jgi:hypothetical protein
VSIGGQVHELRQSLRDLSTQCSELPLPLELPGVEDDRRTARELADQIRDYILPRMAKPKAPLLAVLGGPAGVGKSTLVNSLVGRIVSEPSLLRTGVRTPVLVHHPRDDRWFSGRGVGGFFPDLPRVVDGEVDKAGALRLASIPAAPMGMALLDTPDLDSMSEDNRAPAAQLLSAADLCLFVTSAERYADAASWRFLRTIADRGTTLAVVLNRVPESAAQEVREDLAYRLAEAGLSQAPIFVVVEAEPNEHGVLPPAALGRLKNWLAQLPADAATREALVRQTLDGAVHSLVQRAQELANAQEAQVAAAARLRHDAQIAYDKAIERVDQARSGELMRGEALARWREFVDSGEILGSLKVRTHRIRRDLSEAAVSHRRPGREMSVALTHALEVAIANAADRAAQQTEASWRASHIGDTLLGSERMLGASSPDLLRRSGSRIASWQSYLRRLVAKGQQHDQETPRYLSFGPYGLGLILMAMTVAEDDEMAQQLPEQVLKAVYGAAPARSYVRQSARELKTRVAELMAEERSRYDLLLDQLTLTDSSVERLRATIGIVEAGWSW